MTCIKIFLHLRRTNTGWIRVLHIRQLVWSLSSWVLHMTWGELKTPIYKYFEFVNIKGAELRQGKHQKNRCFSKSQYHFNHVKLVGHLTCYGIIKCIGHVCNSCLFNCECYVIKHNKLVNYQWLNKVVWAALSNRKLIYNKTCILSVFMHQILENVIYSVLHYWL